MVDLLDRLLGHDSWTTDILLQRAAELDDSQLDYRFDIGHQTIRATFSHIIRNMEIWSVLLENGQLPDVDDSRESIAELRDRLMVAASRFASVAGSIRDRDGWDEIRVDPIDGVHKPCGGVIAHLVTHSTHHRAQLLYMLRHSGLDNLPEGDVLSWEFRDRE